METTLNRPDNSSPELSKAIVQEINKHYGNGDLEDWIDEVTESLSSKFTLYNYDEIYERVEAQYWRVHDKDHN